MIAPFFTRQEEDRPSTLLLFLSPPLVSGQLSLLHDLRQHTPYRRLSFTESLLLSGKDSAYCVSLLDRLLENGSSILLDDINAFSLSSSRRDLFSRVRSRHPTLRLEIGTFGGNESDLLSRRHFEFGKILAEHWFCSTDNETNVLSLLRHDSIEGLLFQDARPERPAGPVEGYHQLRVLPPPPLLFLGRRSESEFNNRGFFVSLSLFLRHSEIILRSIWGFSSSSSFRSLLLSRLIVVCDSESEIPGLMRHLESFDHRKDLIVGGCLVHFLCLKKESNQNQRLYSSSIVAGFSMAMLSLDLSSSMVCCEESEMEDDNWGESLCGMCDLYGVRRITVEEIGDYLKEEQTQSFLLKDPSSTSSHLKFRCAPSASSREAFLRELSSPSPMVFPLAEELLSDGSFSQFDCHFSRFFGACVLCGRMAEDEDEDDPFGPDMREEFLELMVDHNSYGDEEVYQTYAAIEIEKSMPSFLIMEQTTPPVVIDEEIEEEEEGDRLFPRKKKKERGESVPKKTTVTMNDLVEFFGSVFFQRGRDYWLDSRVTDLSSRDETSEDGFGHSRTTIHVTSKCRGSAEDPYTQQTRITDGRIIESTCTCPVQSSCKHCCAQLLELFRFEKTVESEFRPECFDDAFSDLLRPRFTIKGYVLGKHRYSKNWVNDQSSGRVASLLFRDAVPIRPSSGRSVESICRIVMFNDNVDRFYSRLRPGCLFLISRVHLRPHNPNYDPSDVDLTVEHDVILHEHSEVKQLTFFQDGTEDKRLIEREKVSKYVLEFRRRVGMARIGDGVAFCDEEEAVVGDGEGSSRKRKREEFEAGFEAVSESPSELPPPKRRKIAKTVLHDNVESQVPAPPPPPPPPLSAPNSEEDDVNDLSIVDLLDF